MKLYTEDLNALTDQEIEDFNNSRAQQRKVLDGQTERTPFSQPDKYDNKEFEDAVRKYLIKCGLVIEVRFD